MYSRNHHKALSGLALAIVMLSVSSVPTIAAETEEVLSAEQLIQVYSPIISAPGLTRGMKADRGIGGVRKGKSTTLASRKRLKSAKNKSRQSFQNILFATNSVNIKGESYQQLDEIGKALGAVMRHYPKSQFLVEGHTDSMGPDHKNEKLSFYRAVAVKKYLVGRFALDSQRISVKGYGEQNPIAANNSAQGRKLNRRVEIVGQ